MVDIQNKSILILAPHTDDELGAGTTVSKLLEQGNEVADVAFSIVEQSVPEGFSKDILKTEVKESTAVLGIKPENLIIFNYEVRKLNYARQEILESLIQIRKQKHYDIIFMPSLKDIHQDHTTIAQEGLRAFKNYTILGYELIWNNLSFDTTCFVKLEKHHVQKKADALKCYRSQGQRDYISEEFVFSLAKARGVQIGT